MREKKEKHERRNSKMVGKEIRTENHSDATMTIDRRCKKMKIEKPVLCTG